MAPPSRRGKGHDTCPWCQAKPAHEPGRSACPRHPTLITDTEALAAFCDRLAASDSSRSTPSSCATAPIGPSSAWCRSAGEHEAAVVDALAPGIWTWRRCGGLLADEAVMKVIHAARAGHRDLRSALRRRAAAAVRHPGRRHGGRLRRAGRLRHAGGARWPAAQIDKAHRFTDWSARPLSAAQIPYAAATSPICGRSTTELAERLEQDGRLDWVAEEMAVLAEPGDLSRRPEATWERLRPRSSNRRFLGHAAGGGRLAGAGGAADQHPPPAPGEGRDPAGDGRHRARRPRPTWRARAASRRASPRAAAAPGCSPRSRRPRRCPKRPARGAEGRGGPSPSPALVALLKVLLAASRSNSMSSPTALRTVSTTRQDCLSRRATFRVHRGQRGRI